VICLISYLIRCSRFSILFGWNLPINNGHFEHLFKLLKLVFIFYHVGFENIQETNSALYFLRSGLSNEVSPGIGFYLKKKVRGGCALPRGDMQKPYPPKCEQRKTKIDLFRDFLQKSPINFIPVKVVVDAFVFSSLLNLHLERFIYYS
jgi:hypothetical protein